MPSEEEEESRPMTALDDLAYDVSDLAATIRLMSRQQARLEIKLDTVLECFRMLGMALEEAGSKVAYVQDELPDRLEALREVREDE